MKPASKNVARADCPTFTVRDVTHAKLDEPKTIQSVTHATSVTMTPAQRRAKWRKTHPEIHAAKQRAYRAHDRKLGRT